jgi:hypothetical protein
MGKDLSVFKNKSVITNDLFLARKSKIVYSTKINSIKNIEIMRGIKIQVKNNLGDYRHIKIFLRQK